MLRQNISLTFDDLTTAKKLAKEADRSLSSFIRELIRDRAKTLANKQGN